MKVVDLQKLYIFSFYRFSSCIKKFEVILNLQKPYFCPPFEFKSKFQKIFKIWVRSHKQSCRVQNFEELLFLEIFVFQCKIRNNFEISKVRWKGATVSWPMGRGHLMAGELRLASRRCPATSRVTLAWQNSWLCLRHFLVLLQKPTPVSSLSLFSLCSPSAASACWSKFNATTHPLPNFSCS
jgi:hypothetical protein